MSGGVGGRGLATPSYPIKENHTLDAWFKKAYGDEEHRDFSFS